MNKNSSDCFYKSTCPHINNACENTCQRHKIMSYLITNSGVGNPYKYINVALKPQKSETSTYLELQNIKNDVKAFVENGKNLFLASRNIQVGITTWCNKILFNYYNNTWIENGYKITGYFLYVPMFLSKAKSFEYRETDEFKHIDNMLRIVDLVVWDDIASMKITTNEQNILNTYIDHRIINNKSNIFNGCFDSNLENLVGKRLADRLNNCSKILVLEGNSRKK